MPKHNFYIAEPYGVSDASLEFIDAAGQEMLNDLNIFEWLSNVFPLYRLTIRDETKVLAFLAQHAAEEALSNVIDEMRATQADLLKPKITLMLPTDFEDTEIPSAADRFEKNLEIIGLNPNFTIKISEFAHKMGARVDLSNPSLATVNIGQRSVFPTALRVGEAWVVGIPIRNDGKPGYVPPQTNLLSWSAWRELLATHKPNILLSNHEIVREQIMKLPHLEVGERMSMN